MKFRSLFLSLFFIIFVCLEAILAQEVKEENEPVYITVTTLHGADGFDIYAWKEVEEERNNFYRQCIVL